MPRHNLSEKSIRVLSCVLAEPAIVTRFSKKSGESVHRQILICFRVMGPPDL
jgi:hypothetical protein